ncbi:MarR family winged helix-turn-helix transcriptional regulator [Paenibacillus sp. N3.4]|uniref:MarR family winged helix-turn-helix transcriptional regulator n=1 Tax=Paenibacillus sp. N3.4 TaxID=2603222 RepID=UPI0011CC6B64|nr:helix-turn-helix domain-containing protein [Paenibacillus sp. N3.4]TXK84259.1 MarR family transcriptional regulator [Paenibacillus sp. N3.4]
MEFGGSNNLVTNWLSLTHIHMHIAGELEQALQAKHQISLNEFYMLLFLSEAPDKKLRLQQLESMVGLSQSAMSRLVSRFEAKGCQSLKRYSCDEDRRSIYTSLTVIGQQKVDQAYVTFQAELSKAVSEKKLETVLEKMFHHKQMP